MFYGNLIALMQKDFKRLLGFSGIAHAGYALLAFVALDEAGYSAAIYYIIGYLLMVLGMLRCHLQNLRDGTNVAISELAGLHRRSPLLALTLGVGGIRLAGIPPFCGFHGQADLARRRAFQGPPGPRHYRDGECRHCRSITTCQLSVKPIFRDPGDLPPIRLDWSTRALWHALIVGILALGSPGQDHEHHRSRGA